MEYISTSSLANALGIKSTDLFDKLTIIGWIERHQEKWILTPVGKQKGGQIKQSTKYDDYIVWPENIKIDDSSPNGKPHYLNATTIGKQFGISSQRLNLILSELGWIEKDIAGWQVTKLGENLGGRQYEHETSGGSYVLWPENISVNKNLTSVFQEVPTAPQHVKIQIERDSIPNTTENFRERFPATFRTRDGHLVRSRAEVIIDNALYEYKLAHAYERKLPIEEDLYSDFFIPSENVYLEFWGMEDDPKYADRKRIKLNVYKKYDFKLIELNDRDISNLDDHLPKKLLKHGIRVY